MKHPARAIVLFSAGIAMAVPVLCRGLYWESVINRDGKNQGMMKAPRRWRNWP